MNPINAKSVQLIELHAFCLLFVICFLIGITSLPQNQQHLCMSNLRERVANIVQTRKLASISNHSSLLQKYRFI